MFIKNLNFKEISITIVLIISAIFGLDEKYFPLQFAISLFIAWQLAKAKNDKNLEMIIAIGIVAIFVITSINYNEKAEQEPLSIETKVKIAQEKCIYDYKIEELKFKDNIGVLLEDEKKIGYHELQSQLSICLEKVNKYKNRLLKRQNEESQQLMNIVDPDRKIRNKAKEKLKNK